MKLTTQSLRSLVKEVLEEESKESEKNAAEDVFPPPPDEQTQEEAEDSLKHDQEIIRFYEEMDKEELTAAIQQEIFKGLGDKIKSGAKKLGSAALKGAEELGGAATHAMMPKDYKDRVRAEKEKEAAKKDGDDDSSTGEGDLAKAFRQDGERAARKDVDREIRDNERWRNANSAQRAAMMSHNRAQRGLREDAIKKIIGEEIFKALKK
jgi:hypothetical protein